MGSVRGALVLSLDFELYWGIRDVVPLDACRDALLRAREAIPRLLEVFTRFEVHATWATVGFLFARDRDELLTHVPALQPTYRRAGLSPYPHLAQLGRGERDDPFHYAPSLIDRIADTPGQEIGTHTFSHYYCLEDGQSASQFSADLDAAARIGARYGDVTRSLVLPRNQWNEAYTPTLRAHGVRSFRVNRDHWFLRGRRADSEGVGLRAARLADSYLPLSRRASVPRPVVGPDPLRLEASLFLRPDGRLRPLAPLKLARVEREMTGAAREGRVLHLLWHPHNFGRDTETAFAGLDRLLRHYTRLRDDLGMESVSMAELAGLSVKSRHPVSESA